MTVRVGKAAVGVILLFVAATKPGVAQGTAGSRYLPVDHWVYEYLQRLRPRGYLTNLSPLARPYTRMDVARGLDRLDPDTLRQPEADWVRLMRQEFGPELERLHGQPTPGVGAEASVGVRGSTGGRLDPLRATGESGAWPHYTLGGWLESGPLAAEGRIAADLFLEDDPDGISPGQRRYGRSDHAYVSAAGSVGSIVIGRFKRDWGPIGSTGLLVSDVPTSYPQIGFELRAGRLMLQSLVGELDTLLGQKRYLAGHRLQYSTPDFAVALGETALYASASEGVRPRYLNPVEVFFFDPRPYDHTVNLMLDVQWWARIGRVALFGEGVLDDLDLIPPDGVDPAPTRYAFSVGVDLSLATPLHRIRVEYRQVSSFAYRTESVFDQYRYLGRGLGANFADYDRLDLALEPMVPIRGLIVSSCMGLLRQGEGDLRAPMPLTDEFRASPALFLGTTERTFRLALRARYQATRFFWIAADVGQNFVANADHVDGASRSEFAAVAEVGGSVGLPWD